MATRKKITVAQPVKMTAAQMRNKIEELEHKIEIYENDTAWCYMCGKPKRLDSFYFSSDPMIQSGVTPICKDCARKIALRVDKNGEEHSPTRESIIMALKYLDKPFLEVVYNASINECNNQIAKNKKKNVWSVYIRTVSMVNYVGMTLSLIHI